MYTLNNKEGSAPPQSKNPLQVIKSRNNQGERQPIV